MGLEKLELGAAGVLTVINQTPHGHRQMVFDELKKKLDLNPRTLVLLKRMGVNTGVKVRAKRARRKGVLIAKARVKK